MQLSIWYTVHEGHILERETLSFYFQNLCHVHQKWNYNIACVVTDLKVSEKLWCLSNHSIYFKTIIS